MTLRIDQKPLKINSIKILKVKNQRKKWVTEYKNNSEVPKRNMDKNFKRIKSNSAQEKSEGIIYAKGKFHDTKDSNKWLMIISDKWVIYDNYINDYK